MSDLNFFFFFLLLESYKRDDYKKLLKEISFRFPSELSQYETVAISEKQHTISRQQKLLVQELIWLIAGEGGLMLSIIEVLLAVPEVHEADWA